MSCEDDHPPVVDQPVEEFTLATPTRGDGLKLAFDPRGLRKVAIGDHAAGTWTRPEQGNVWHYREWQWWKGHPWGDSCRPRYWADVTFRNVRDQILAAVIDYRVDGFENRQTFLIPQSADPETPYWDLVTTIRNISGQDVEEYGQFFACYTPLNRDRSFWYWSSNQKWELFSAHDVTHLDGYVVHPDAYFRDSGAIPHCPRGDGRIVDTWHWPIMISHVSPAGWRSLIMLETKHAASLAHGMAGVAMDYVLYPGPDERRFPAGAHFSVHVRHIMLKSPELPTAGTLTDLWHDFEQSHAQVKARARVE